MTHTDTAHIAHPLTAKGREGTFAFETPYLPADGTVREGMVFVYRLLVDGALRRNPDDKLKLKVYQNKLKQARIILRCVGASHRAQVEESFGIELKGGFMKFTENLTVLKSI